MLSQFVANLAGRIFFVMAKVKQVLLRISPSIVCSPRVARHFGVEPVKGRNDSAPS